MLSQHRHKGLSFSKEIKINRNKIGGNGDLYIISEMACAHDGIFKNALQLIDTAVLAGANAIQLQVFNTESQVLPGHKLYPLLKSLEFSAQQWNELFSYARDQNIDVFSFIYDIPSLGLVHDFDIDGIKISSSDLSNPELLAETAKLNKPVTLGTGASSLKEIEEALEILNKNGNDKVILMHGVQNFPTKIEDAKINKITRLRELFDLPVGYQDHTSSDTWMSMYIDFVALGAGATVIEKHITMDRSKKGTDYQAALEPAEFKLFVKQLREISQSIYKDDLFNLSESDYEYRRFQKKVIVTSRRINKGEQLSRDMVLFIRNESPGLSPDAWGKIKNRQIKKDYMEHQIIDINDIE